MWRHGGSALDRSAERARERRACIFRAHFFLGPDTRILDLGSGDGRYIASVIHGTRIKPSNVYVADIWAAGVKEAESTFGFKGVVISELGSLSFPDKSFDIVFCNSVIEHVTLPKAELWTISGEREFRLRSLQRQRQFANEIRRIGLSYFVQTPYKWFPLEPHTRLPFASWLPRRMLLSVLRVTHPTGVPDWSFLSISDMGELFPDGQLILERALGMVKSIVMVKAVLS